jgi:hypothetical protein
MPSLSSRKAQFFVLTTVVIVGVFYTLSKYINPYAFVDTSRAASGSETFFFDNVKEKAIKTVNISSPGDLESNLARYKNFVENMASEKGYKLIFNYTIGTSDVDINMILVSEKITLKSNFNIPIS